MKKYFAELIGAAELVLVGCASAVIAGSHISYTGIAFAFGLTVLVMVYAIGPIYGCHINPAITVAMWVANKIKDKRRDFLYHCLVYRCHYRRRLAVGNCHGPTRLHDGS